MLFTREFKEAIRAGRMTRTYRRWRRPQAKVGGRYDLHPRGTIEVTSIERIPAARITARGATKAGFSSREALLEQLGAATDDEIYQIEFSYLGTGQEKSTDTRALTDADLTAMLEQLARDLAENEPARVETRARAQSSQEKREQAEHEMQLWQSEWDAFNTRANEASQTAQVERTRIDHLERQLG